MVHGVKELALIAYAVGVDGDTASGDLAVFPCAFVGAAIGKDDLADAVRFAAGELALIDRSVGKTRHARAADFALGPFAGIFVTVGQGVGAGAVLQPVLEGALVDAAILVLLGLDVAVLRQRAPGGGNRDGKRYGQPLFHVCL